MNEKLYTEKEFQEAYQNWATAKPCYRNDEWFRYCDIRDNEPLGTSKNKYSRVKKIGDPLRIQYN